MIEAIFWVLFVLGCVLLSAVILLQEGKGGGLGEAFGGIGQQTFGVRAEGITKFTGYLMGAIVLLAIFITRMRTTASVVEVNPDPVEIPAGTTDTGGAGTPPADGETGG